MTTQPITATTCIICSVRGGRLLDGPTCKLHSEQDQEEYREQRLDRKIRILKRNKKYADGPEYRGLRDKMIDKINRQKAKEAEKAAKEERGGL